MGGIRQFLAGLVFGALTAGALLGTCDRDSPPPGLSEVMGKEAARAAGGARLRLSDLPPRGEESRAAEADPRRLAYLCARATIEAVEGDLGSFLGEVEAALEGGAHAGHVRDLIDLLPEPTMRREAFETIAARHPDLPFDVLFRSEILWAAGDRRAAFDLVAAALLDADDPEALTVMLVRWEPEQAGPVVLTAADRRDWAPGHLFTTGKLLIDAGQTGFGTRLLTLALEKKPNLDEAFKLLRSSAPGPAVRFAREEVARRPESAAAWARLAAVLGEEGDDVGAYDAHLQAARHTPGNREDRLAEMLRTAPKSALADIEKLARETSGPELGMLGVARLADGDAQRAFQAFTRAQRLNPTDLRWLRAMVELDPGEASLRLAECMESYSGGSRDEVIGAYANALTRLGRGGEAYDLYLEAAQIDQSDGEWLQGLAAVDPSRALPLLEERQTGKPDCAYFTGALADALAGLGEKGEAERLYRKAIEGTENSGFWKIALARVNPEGALSLLRADVEESPEGSEAWGSLGDAFRNLGRTAEARRAYGRARRLDPADWRWQARFGRLD